MYFIIYLILTSLNLFCLNSQDSCQPLWPRIEFGNVFSDQSSPEKLILKFNTKSPCPKSYATITDSKGTIRKTYCQSKMISTSQNMGSYKTFVQRCSVESIQFEETIGYIAYGANSTLGTAIPFTDKTVQASIMNPNSNRTVKLVLLADWSELHSKVGIYKSLNESLDKIRLDQNIDGVIVNGDIAYDLDSNNGTNYEEFLNLVSRIGRFVPFFYVTGNHEHNSKDNLLLYYNTFEQYGMDTKLTTAMNFGSVYMVAFDPYETVYSSKLQNTNLRRVEGACLQAMTQSIQKAKSSGKNIVTISHYPLKCSASAKNCQHDVTILKDYFDLMFQNDIKFYIGAHYHTYERIYPYCKNGTFQLTQSPYNFGEAKCIVSIVEGIAGNDDKIVQSYENVQNYTAALSFNKTGFGLFQAEMSRMSYQHYSTDNLLTVQDRFQVLYPSNSEIKLVDE